MTAVESVNKALERKRKKEQPPAPAPEPAKKSKLGALASLGSVLKGNKK